MFFRHNGSKFALWSVLMIGLMFLAGCLIVQPVVLEEQEAAPFAVVEDPAEAAKPMPIAITLPEDVSDRGALAEYQAHLVDLARPAVETVAGSSDQIADHQALAEYQAHLVDLARPAVSATDSAQIVDRQALAEYQAHLGDLTAPVIVIVTNSSDQIADRQALAEYQAHLRDLTYTASTFNPIPVTFLPDRISNRQVLAEYQASLGN